MVRLEDDRQGKESKHQLSFQFHDGAIRSTCVLHGCGCKRRFNSTMVRLEAGSSLPGHRFDQFQFHDGAIRRTASCFKQQPANQFQFHDGAIRSRIVT